jgi:hypothetical protein
VGSPYRDAPARIPDEVRGEQRPESLATLDVSGRRGADGKHGAPGMSGGRAGAHGSPGGRAGPAEVGEDAGVIQLTLEATDIENVARIAATITRSEGSTEEIDTVRTISADGFVELLAIGGEGGEGGRGGAGGGGAPGSDGADATRWSSGQSGGAGGMGGPGGDGSSGAPGGSGGRIVVSTGAGSTHLLMLVRHAVDGGGGGAPGRNGAGGPGGPGGRGGSSHSWTETDYYTDSEGNTQSRTSYHSNPGGADGPPGASGPPGNARLTPGADGADGQVVFEVRGAGGEVARYSTRYHLQLVSFAHASSNRDLVYEPLEEIEVTDLVIENAGGMPTPAAEVRVALSQDGWVDTDESVSLAVPRALEPGQRVELDGALRFRVGDFRPHESADPLDEVDVIRPFCEVVPVRRRFDGFQRGDALGAGEFVIRFPARISAITALPCLAPGEVSRMRWSVTNQSRLPLGAGSESERRLRVRLVALEGELGDREISLFDEGDSPLAPSAGYTREIERLDPGESAELEIGVGVRDGAPAYKAITLRLSLELGGLDEPGHSRSIQLRDAVVRVAQSYRHDPAADLLLVVNHRTTSEELAAWQRLAGLLGFTLNLWDLSLEKHLDLEAPVVAGRSLIDHFAGGTIAVLDNAIDVGGAEIYPHQLLSKAGVHAANSAAIHVAFIGGDPELDRLLMPLSADGGEVETPASESTGELVTALEKVPDTALAVSRARVEVSDREWWGGLPDVADLGEEAAAVQKELVAAYPDRRYVVVYDFEPEVESKFLWIKKWKVGDVEVKSTIDPVAGSVVHTALADHELHSPEHVLGDANLSTLCLARGFDANLERLGELVRAGSAPRLGDGGAPYGDAQPPAPSPAEVDADRVMTVLVHAMLAELANEQDAVTSTGWRDGLSADECRAKMPRLAALAGARLADGDALPGTPEGTQVVELGARIRFFAEAQVRLWERAPLIRFLRRAPTVMDLTRDAVEALFERTFGEHARAATRMMKERIDHFEDREPGGGYYARALLYEVRDRADITTDDELAADASARILSREDFEALRARDLEHAEGCARLTHHARDTGSALQRAESVSDLLSRAARDR